MPPLLLQVQTIRSRFVSGLLGLPPFLGFPTPPVDLRIFGVTKDSTGAALGSCTVDLFTTTDNVLVATTVSDASGNYEFRGRSTSFTHYVVAYKAGSPDVSGTTVNTLVGS